MHTNTVGGQHDRPMHNHMTRDIKPRGAGCPACDAYWDRHPGYGS